MAEAKGTIQCTICKTDIAVTFHRQPSNDMPRWAALISVDLHPIHKHMQECAKATPTQTPAALQESPARQELTGRIHRMLLMHAFADKAGSRACTMCGTDNETCMALLRSGKPACCAPCADGNTHPNPQGTKGCAEWAADRATQD